MLKMSALNLFPGYTHAHSQEFLGLWFWGRACRGGQREKVRASVVYSHTSMGVYDSRSIPRFFSVIYILQLSTKEVRRQRQAALNHSSVTSVKDLKRNNTLYRYLWM